MWVAKQLDMPWSLLARGLRQTQRSEDRAAAQTRAEHVWTPDGDGLATLSVRSGFDLGLTAARFPPGSEILMSAVTLDDMRRIVEAHGLRVIPLDVDEGRLSPDVGAARELLSARTRAVVVAHLFGGRVDLRPWGEFCRRHELMLIEDCAQAYDGTGFKGHPDATVSMFSFGPIKTATALGGALLTIRDTALRERMREVQQSWPVQNTGDYRRRLLTYGALKCASGRRVYGLLRRRRPRSDATGGAAALRNFPGRDLFTEMRHQPCSALLNTLAVSLERFDSSMLERRIATAKRLRELLDDSIVTPGDAAAPHNHWVFPVLAPHPPSLIAALAYAGFDAIHAASMQAIAPPADRSDIAPTTAVGIARRLVYLPCYPEMPERELARLAKTVREALPATQPARTSYNRRSAPKQLS